MDYAYDGDEGPAFLKDGADLSTTTNIRRPHASSVDASKQDFIFMQIDTDYYTQVTPGK